MGRGGSISTLAIALLAMPGCGGSGVPGSGVPRTEVRVLPAFRHVSLFGDGLVEITLGAPSSLDITVDDNLLPLIETRVDEGRLVIEPVEPIRPRKDPRVRITLPALDGIALAGYPEFRVTDLQGQSFEISIRGNGIATVTGRTDRLETSIEGNGDIRATGLEAREARVRVAGAGKVEVHATERLFVSIRGSGDVRYLGDPEVTQDVPGVGSVERIE